MIISFNSLSTDTKNNFTFHICTRFSFERILDEVSCMKIEELIDEEDIQYNTPSEPFMLDRIYLN